MVKKKYGSIRVCVDFRKLNKMTEVDPEPMTMAQDLFRRLSGKSSSFSLEKKSAGIQGNGFVTH